MRHMCGKDLKRLLLHCQVATQLWETFLNMFRVRLMMPAIVKDVILNLNWNFTRGKDAELEILLLGLLQFSETVVGEKRFFWPWMLTWKTSAPYKVAYFTCFVAQEASLTYDIQRGRFLTWWNLTGARDIQVSFRIIRKTKRNEFQTIPTCIWWTIQRERNSKYFVDKGNSIQKIKMNCLLLFYFGVNRAM